MGRKATHHQCCMDKNTSLHPIPISICKYINVRIGGIVVWLKIYQYHTIVTCTCGTLSSHPRPLPSSLPSLATALSSSPPCIPLSLPFPQPIKPTHSPPPPSPNTFHIISMRKKILTTRKRKLARLSPILILTLR